MARKHQAAELLRNGYSIPEIAEEMGITNSSVKQYLCTMVGEGKIRRSDILFSISRAHREAIKKAIRGNGSFDSGWIERKFKYAISREEIDVFMSLEDKAALLGDMYDYIREIELALHNIIQFVLRQEFKNNWWNKGIPMVIRTECAKRKEEDVEQSEWEHSESEQAEDLLPDEDKYRYTTFIQLSTIIDKQWNIFSNIFSKVFTGGKKQLCGYIERLNRIRNKVMHPVKRSVFTEEDFSFVHDFHKMVSADKLKNGSWLKKPC